MSILGSLSNTLSNFATQTIWPFLTEEVGTRINHAVATAWQNPEQSLAAALLTFAITNQERISRSIFNGMNACRHQWGKVLHSQSAKTPTDQASSLHSPSKALLSEMLTLNPSIIIDQPFNSPSSHSGKSNIKEILAEAGDRAWYAERAIGLLPERLQTPEICKILIKANYQSKNVAEAILSLPEHLQKLEIYETLIKDPYYADVLAKAILSLPKNLQTKKTCEILAKDGYCINKLIQALLSLPLHLQKEEIFDVLIEADYNASQVAKAIALLPEYLLKAEVYQALINDKHHAVEVALTLTHPKEVSQEPNIAVDESFNSKLSQCIGRRPGPKGIGFIYEYRIYPQFLSDPNAAREAQEELLPAPEGPNSFLYQISSEGMWHLVRFILQGKEDPSKSLFENCRKAQQQLIDQLAQFNQDQEADNPEALAFKEWQQTFNSIFISWNLQQLGYSAKTDGTWTVPDAEALQHSLKDLKIPIEIGVVNGIVSDVEFLNIALTHDVVLGDLAHDHWFHVMPQLAKFFTEPSPGKYIQEREEMRSLTNNALQALDQYPDQQDQRCKLFRTVLGSYLDFATASSDFNYIQNLEFQSLYMMDEFASFLSKLYPELSDKTFKRQYWNEQFLPFARKLIEESIQNERIRDSLLSKLKNLSE
jgi:hypothetical protein